MSLQDSHQISDVKVMLVKGIDGNGIASIEKTGSQGLVDVYTITYTDGTKSTFTVTNGANAGMSARIFISSEAGSDVSVTSPSAQSLVVEQVSGSSTLWFCDTTEYGTHLIDSVLGGDDAQVSLNVDACKIYTVDDSHFHADITVTFPSGASCSCGKSGETPVYATDNPFTFTVHSAGEYIITMEVYGQTYTSTVALTTSGQEETVSMIPVGSTVTPTDDVQTLLACTGIGDSEITTIAGLLADSTTLSAVTTSQNAVDYLVRSTTFASDFCASEDGMMYVGLNNYCANTLIDDSTWLNGIANSAYIDYVLNNRVPAMTDNTHPSGVCSKEYQNENAYICFDGNESTGTTLGFDQSYGNQGRLKYKFPNQIKLYAIKYTGVRRHYVTNTAPEYKQIAFYFQASNDDGANWTTITDTVSGAPADEGLSGVLTVNGLNYQMFMLVISNGYYGGYAKEIQYYGRKDV